MPRLLAAGLALVALAAAGCGSGDGGAELRSDLPREQPATRMAHEAQAATVDLGAAVLRSLGDPSAGNLAVAPQLLAQELAIVRLGAGGSTAAALDELLAVDSGTSLAPALAAAEMVLDSRTGDQRNARRRGRVTLDQGTSVWAQRGTDVDEAYLDELARWFGLGVNLIDFRSDPEAARGSLNTWASDTTGGRVNQLLSRGRITADTRLMTAATLWFAAPWAQPFDPQRTRDEPFSLSDGRTLEVPTMRLLATNGVSYAEGGGWEAVELRYLGDEFSLIVVVPDEGHFDAIHEAFGAEVLHSVRSGLRQKPVDLRLPRFAFTTELSLQRTLVELGAADLFSLDDADLSLFAPAERVALSDVVQQVFFSVDEDGTEATAATLAEEVVAPTTGVVDLHVDRPFLFAVIDRASDLPLLLGRVTDPST